MIKKEANSKYHIKENRSSELSLIMNKAPIKIIAGKKDY